MRMSAKTSSIHTGFEPRITKEMIGVSETSPGESKDREKEHLPLSFSEWWRWGPVLIYPQCEKDRWQLLQLPQKRSCFLPSPGGSSLLDGLSKISVFSSRWCFAGLFRFPQLNLSIKPFSTNIITEMFRDSTHWGTILVCSIFILLSVLWKTWKIHERLSWFCFLPDQTKTYNIIVPHFLAYKFPFKFLQQLPLHLLYHILVFHLWFKALHSTSASCVSPPFLIASLPLAVLFSHCS